VTLEGISLNAYELLGMIIAIPSAITIPITAFLIKLKGKTEQHDSCITRLEKKIDSLSLQLERYDTKIQQSRQEADLEIEKAKSQVEREREKMAQKVERLSSDVEMIREKVTESEKIHIEIKNMIRDNQNFFIDWIQRLEDVTRDRTVLRTKRRRKIDLEDTDG